MKLALLVIALAQAVSCGNIGLRSSSLISPAGVTYVDGSYHAGLTAGPVAYSSVPQAVFQSGPAVAVASQSVVPTAAVAAYAAPAPRYAAVPTVQHVPGVADVPVTRVEAQPAVIQKTVDVARPAVKTQRYEVRRPAIQKQFYDIEERVVVRPAGSALLELEEPLSRTQKGPSVIRPTGEGVAVTSSVTVPGVSEVSAGSPAPPPLPSVDISRGQIVTGPPSPPGISGLPPSPSISSVSALPPAPPVSGVSALPPAAAPSYGVNLGRSSFAATAPAAPAVSAVSPSPLPSVNLARSSFAAAAPVGPAVSTVSAAPAAYQSAGINIARSSFAAAPAAPTVSAVSPAPAAYQSAGINLARSSFAVGSFPVQSAPISTHAFAGRPLGVSVSAPVSVSAHYPASAPIQVVASAPTITDVSSISAGSSGISSVSAGASGISFSTPAPQYPQQIVSTTPSPQFDDSVSIDSADIGLARSSASARQEYQGNGVSRQGYQSVAPQTFVASSPVPTRDTVFRAELSPRRFTGQPSAAPQSSLVVNYPNALDLVPQARFGAAPVYAEGSAQSQINHENQQKLIQLLTARGGVTEVGFGRSGSASYPVEAGEVRARVISATPAPAYSAPTGERVNTRRVVVSRPIETLQEVEVAEPVTKYERIRVDQPTVIKTARQDVVRVPTSVPVYGKALAPIAEAPVAAYSAGWR